MAHVRVGSMRRACWAGVLTAWATMLACGCAQQDKPAGTPVEQAWESPAPGPAQPSSQSLSAVAAEPPATQPGTDGLEQVDPAEAIVTVNGKPIARGQLVNMLIETHGLSLLQQLILLTAAQQKGAQMGLTVTSADVAAENDDALRRISLPLGGEGAKLDRPVAEQLLKEFMLAKNISAAEWNLRMEQRAWVHKIAADQVHKTPITPDMLREEYALAYGERVQVRHIQVSSLAAATRVADDLRTGKDFALVARERSENQITAAGGGVMPAFTRNDPAVPPAIRESAFRLEIGDVSAPVQDENWYHIVKLERRFPASSVKFENADQDALRKRLVDRLVGQQRDKLEQDLFQSAHVDFRNDTLRRQFNEKFRK